MVAVVICCLIFFRVVWIVCLSELTSFSRSFAGECLWRNRRRTRRLVFLLFFPVVVGSWGSSCLVVVVSSDAGLFSFLERRRAWCPLCRRFLILDPFVVRCGSFCLQLQQRVRLFP